MPAPAAPVGITELARYRPDPAAAPAVIAWLARHGIVGHDAGFAVAAAGPRARVLQLFGQPGSAAAVPAALAAWVTAIEPSLPPDFPG